MPQLVPDDEQSEQARLFPFDVVKHYTEIEEADDEMLKDFALWTLWNYQDNTRTLWDKFMRDIGAARK